ncbi:hypothetical protein CBR_g81579 [Chara braunii]|uniref:tRNA pseudouridine(55) synthase n=1 Tax=Chara braunii TaxID=69332 RepID=A0A388KAR3_CHABU|nr:hypothetical protein CBR_g81579 [Chara braunii]|eukprot:GBG67154.1 hypothetical protein CBR_g81579 [Chara braunii]
MKMGSNKEKDPLVLYLSSVNARQCGSIVADLLTLGVCTRCVLRFFGVYDSQVYRCAPGDPRVVLRRLAFIKAKKGDGVVVKTGKKTEAQGGACLESPAEVKDEGVGTSPTKGATVAGVCASLSEGSPTRFAESSTYDPGLVHETGNGKDSSEKEAETGNSADCVEEVRTVQGKAKAGIEGDGDQMKRIKAVASSSGIVCPACLGVLQKVAPVADGDKATDKARSEGEASRKLSLEEKKTKRGTPRAKTNLGVVECQRIGRDGKDVKDGENGNEQAEEGPQSVKKVGKDQECRQAQEEIDGRSEEHLKNQKLQGNDGLETIGNVPASNAAGTWDEDIVKMVAAVRKEGHKFKTFQLEVILPSVLTLRQCCLWYYLCSDNYTKKFPHATELFKGPKALLETLVSVKDAVKWTLSSHLEKALGCRYDTDPEGKICLTYSHRDSFQEVENFLEACGGVGKRRKHAREYERYDRQKVGGTSVKEGGSEMLDEGDGEDGRMHERERDFEEECLASVHRGIESTNMQTFMRICQCPPKSLAGTCALSVTCQRFPVYIGGRYLKLRRGIPQSPWSVDGERVGEPSVQERIADVVFPTYKADSYKFNAAGREDMDVRMIGKGRPFVMEIVNARQIPSPSSIASMEKAIHEGDGGGKWAPRGVAVIGLRSMTPDAYALVREAESEKQKSYCAVVWLSRPVTEDDITKLNSMPAVTIQQRTPIRVLHRRSPLVRPRVIEKMIAKAIPGQTNYLKLTFDTQAGTYVKEFVHGDMGRTQPHLGEILGCETDILKLDVTEIKMTFV